jgi:mannose-6-phosphate isomerase-like protein (cupin superfamily)
MTGRINVSDLAKPFSLGADEGKILFVLGDIVIIKLSGAQTGGVYSVIEAINVPGGGAAFLHTHISQETFWVLEGDYEIYGQDEDGNKTAIPASAGAMVHVAGNVPHGYRNVGKTTGKVLSIGAPASNMIDFFNDIGIVMESASDPLPFDKMPSGERIAEALEKHKIVMLEDPGAVA